MPTLAEMIAQSPRGLTNDLIIAFDPGETTGVSVILGDQILESSQLITNKIPLGALLVHNFIGSHVTAYGGPDESTRRLAASGHEYVYTRSIWVVHEIYRVYKWKSEDHINAALHTPRLIGAIELSCAISDLTCIGQTPQVAKTFCTDDNLRAWGVYNKGSPHARDSLRHAIYFALFGLKNSS